MRKGGDVLNILGNREHHRAIGTHECTLFVLLQVFYVNLPSDSGSDDVLHTSGAVGSMATRDKSPAVALKRNRLYQAITLSRA
jgi:hypothetical protein